MLLQELPDRLVTLTLTTLDNNEITDFEVQGLLVEMDTVSIGIIVEDGYKLNYLLFTGVHEHPQTVYCSKIDMIHDEEAVMDFTMSVQHLILNNQLTRLARNIIREFKEIMSVVPEDFNSLSENLFERIKAEFEK